jgi:hypothetical protein
MFGYVEKCLIMPLYVGFMSVYVRKCMKMFLVLSPWCFHPGRDLTLALLGKVNLDCDSDEGEAGGCELLLRHQLVVLAVKLLENLLLCELHFDVVGFVVE